MTPLGLDVFSPDNPWINDEQETKRIRELIKEFLRDFSIIFPLAKSKQCRNALREAHANFNAVRRAEQGYEIVRDAAEANGIDAAILTSIAIRETGFRNIREVGAGHGWGIFQIDDRSHKNAKTIGSNPQQSAQYAAALLASNIARYIAYGPDLSVAAGIRDYNAGSKYTKKKLDSGGGIAALDRGTTGNNYASNVLNLARYCFGAAWILSDPPSTSGGGDVG